MIGCIYFFRDKSLFVGSLGKSVKAIDENDDGPVRRGSLITMPWSTKIRGGFTKELYRGLVLKVGESDKEKAKLNKYANKSEEVIRDLLSSNPTISDDDLVNELMKVVLDVNENDGNQEKSKKRKTNLTKLKAAASPKVKAVSPKVKAVSPKKAATDIMSTGILSNISSQFGNVPFISTPTAEVTNSNPMRAASPIHVQVPIANPVLPVHPNDNPMPYQMPAANTMFPANPYSPANHTPLASRNHNPMRAESPILVQVPIVNPVLHVPPNDNPMPYQMPAANTMFPANPYSPANHTPLASRNPNPMRAASPIHVQVPIVNPMLPVPPVPPYDNPKPYQMPDANAMFPANPYSPANHTPSRNHTTWQPYSTCAYPTSQPHFPVRPLVRDSWNPNASSYNYLSNTEYQAPLSFAVSDTIGSAFHTVHGSNSKGADGNMMPMETNIPNDVTSNIPDEDKEQQNHNSQLEEDHTEQADDFDPMVQIPVPSSNVLTFLKDFIQRCEDRTKVPTVSIPYWSPEVKPKGRPDNAIDKIQLLKPYPYKVDRRKLRSALGDATVASPEKASYLLLSKLIPILFTREELASATGTGKRAGCQNPLDCDKMAACTEYVISWCRTNDKPQPLTTHITEAFTQQMSYSRRWVKRRSQVSLSLEQ